MTTVARQQILDGLEQGWKSYTQRFLRLSMQEQTAFLQRQGYARLGDLMAHITAWWRESIPAIERMQTDPNFQSPDVDVDAFNARAVAAAAKMTDDEIMAFFDATRQKFTELVQRLPDTAFEDARIQWRLNIEIIGHLEEHALPA